VVWGAVLLEEVGRKRPENPGTASVETYHLSACRALPPVTSTSVPLT